MIKRIGPSLKYADLFSGLEPEFEQRKDRKIKIKSGKGIEGLLRIFERTLFKDPFNEDYNDELYEDSYSRCERSLRRKYSSKEIEQFSLCIIKYQDRIHFSDYAGLYLSALINNCKDKSVIVHTQYNKGLFRLGFENNKAMVVYGDAGDNLGMRNSGEIIVYGNAENWLGDENSGRIIINGKTGFIIGGEMTDGEIIINGNSGDLIGDRMQGGKIHLNGDYETISKEIKGGDVYNKGKLIIKDGKEIPGEEVRWHQWQ
jgi:formylmethanofuran dehydrogenase subunit C